MNVLKTIILGALFLGSVFGVFALAWWISKWIIIVFAVLLYFAAFGMILWILGHMILELFGKRRK